VPDALKIQLTAELKDPPWIALAKRHLGLTERAGPNHNAEILQFWKDIKRGGIKDDETAWCAAFVGAMLERSGIVSTRFEGAGSYTSYGTALMQATYGCIACFQRPGGNHTGFEVGRTASGDLLILGGNQKNAVNIREFSPQRLIARRWPPGMPILNQLPPLGTAPTSTQES
jgi:uncharacterized protein (TIGR02594 family)